MTNLSVVWHPTLDAYGARWVEQEHQLHRMTSNLLFHQGFEWDESQITTTGRITTANEREL